MTGTGERVLYICDIYHFILVIGSGERVTGSGEVVTCLCGKVRWHVLLAATVEWFCLQDLVRESEVYW